MRKPTRRDFTKLCIGLGTASFVPFLESPKVMARSVNTIPVGTDILCSVYFFHEPGVTFHQEFERPNFQVNNDGSRIIYVELAPQYCNETWQVAVHQNQSAPHSCICHTDIPDDWTHFKVAGIGDGQTIVVPISGKPWEDVFRHYPYEKLPHDEIPTI